MLLKACSTQHRPALSRFEGNGGFRPALGTGGAGFRTHLLVSAQPLSLALFAALGVVFELFVVEEDLLASSEDKFCAAVNARKYSISEFHGRLPWKWGLVEIGLDAQDRRSRFPDSVRDSHHGARAAS